MLECLRDETQWRYFYEYKVSCGNTPEWLLRQLRQFMEQKRYLAVADRIDAGEPFPPPKKTAISKLHSEKKRIVYTYPHDENFALKFINYLLLRRYDDLFARNLYSFRANSCVAHAIRDIAGKRHVRDMWVYKVDIRDYFNSIPVDRLLPMLEQILSEEPKLYRFLASLLLDSRVNDNGVIVSERKGIMAGTPISTFLANLYLRDMDAMFQTQNRIYARYSDDIMILASTQEQLEQDIATIRTWLKSAGLEVNPRKESCTAPGEQWVFLGVSYLDGNVDVAPVSVEKIKAKMRRKTRALKRWADRKKVPGIFAAKAFIKTFNRKLFQSEGAHELTWARWYFPLITTADSLHIIDEYAQSCIRYLATGKRTKAAYDFRYEQMKELGYISLVNAYYRYCRGLEYERRG